MHGKSPRHRGGVTRGGFGNRVVVIRLREVCARDLEPMQATMQLRTPALEVVTTHLVDRDEHDERGFGILQRGWQDAACWHANWRGGGGGAALAGGDEERAYRAQRDLLESVHR